MVCQPAILIVQCIDAGTTETYRILVATNYKQNAKLYG